MAAAGAKDITIERLLGRPIIPLFRTVSEGKLVDDRTDEEKLAEIHEVAAIFAEEYAEGERNLANVTGLTNEQMRRQSEEALMRMDDTRELFEEAGMLKPRPQMRRQPVETSKKTKKELDELHEEFKDFM
jgi:hypothetical protein